MKKKKKFKRKFRIVIGVPGRDITSQNCFDEISRGKLVAWAEPRWI